MKKNKKFAIIGAGPSGLMAAEILAKAGHKVLVYDRMPNAGRKFLRAGIGGLNLTHSEKLADFIARYGKASSWIAPYIEAFSPDDLRNWCHDLGQETFIGSSGRVFPKSMKAAPLLRAWLERLQNLGVQFFMRHAWQGFDAAGALQFKNEEQQIISVKVDATLLSLGGASWPRLGSDGGWVSILEKYGVEIAPLCPANCGFVTDWSDNFKQRFAGVPLKSVRLSHKEISTQGEVMITAQGIEGGAVYAMAANLRESIARGGEALLHIDLRPGMSGEQLTQKLQMPRGDQTFSNYLRKAGFASVAGGLLREVIEPAQMSPQNLAATLKALPIKLTATTSIARAISTAGGIKLSAVNNDLMLNAMPAIFVAGEMLDWEAPTGGYLLQGCFSTAVAAASGMLKHNEYTENICCH